MYKFGIQFGNFENIWKFGKNRNLQKKICWKSGKNWKSGKKLETWKKFGNLENIWNEFGNLENI